MFGDPIDDAIAAINDPFYEVGRQQYIIDLGLIGVDDQRAMQTLVNLLKDTDPNVRLTALGALENAIGDKSKWPNAIAWIKKASVSDSNDAVKVFAAAVYQRLTATGFFNLQTLLLVAGGLVVAFVVFGKKLTH